MKNIQKLDQVIEEIISDVDDHILIHFNSF